MSDLENILVQQIQWAKLPAPHREYCHVIPKRKYRFDLAWPEFRFAVEVQGATWIKAAHSTGGGIERDCEKIVLAQLAGWNVFPVTGGQIQSGLAIRWIQSALRQYEETK